MNGLLTSPLLLAPEGYQISRSVRLRSLASAYFNRTFAAGNRKTWTFATWLKRGKLGADQDLISYYASGLNETIRIGTDDKLYRYCVDSSGTVNRVLLNTNAVLRDPSAWYHIVVVQDTTQATNTDRVKIYINGVQQSVSATVWPALNWDSYINSAIVHSFGGTQGYTDGYLTETYFIDGQALTPSSFGETDAVTGVWKPKKYAGTYGTNGFYINFSDNSAATAAAIGKDYSGNGNNWTPNNISVTAGTTYDSMLDVPTQWADGGNGRGNYAVLNPIDPVTTSTFSEGNLKYTNSTNNRAGFGTPLPSAGKWYWELVWTTNGGSSSPPVGICAINYDQTANGRLAYRPNGNKMDQAGTETAYGSTWTVNDVIGVAVDLDSGKIWFAKNGTWQNSGDPAAGTNAAFTTVLSAITNPVKPFIQVNVAGDVLVINFGQRPFTYTPPTGFKALNTLNLPAPTILKGNQYMNVVTYTATPGTGNTISGVGFQTDLLWTKNRDNVEQHYWQDSVRGFSPSAGVTQMLSSNSTAAETSVAGITCTTTSDGFTVVDSAPASGEFWFTNRTYVAWCWKEGATQGFDIVTYTGTSGAQNISHSLGVAPAMIITKVRNNAGGNWAVYHKSLGNTGGMWLNLTNAFTTQSLLWNNTSPTSSVFSVGSNNTDTNWNTYNFIAYLFAEVAGFSKFGSYTGNGSTDGPFVFCGFRPRFVMWKRSDATANWFLMDSSRTPANPVNLELYADQSNAEVTFTDCDFLSNGFKLRTSDSSRNASGGTYIYMAFAENPFKNALAR